MQPPVFPLANDHHVTVDPVVSPITTNGPNGRRGPANTTCWSLGIDVLEGPPSRLKRRFLKGKRPTLSQRVRRNLLGITMGTTPEINIDDIDPPYIRP